MNVTVSINDKALIDKLIGLGKYTRPALSTALNKAAGTVRTEISKTIRETLNLKAGAAKSSIKVGRANPSHPEASLRISGWPVPLIGFVGTRETGKGVSVKVYKRGKRTLIKHAFIATMKSGHRGVYWRKKGSTSYSKDNRSGFVGRLPIEERYSIAVQQALKTANLAPILDIAKTRIRVELASQISRYAARKSASA